MRARRVPRSLLAVAALLLATPSPASANPFSKLQDLASQAVERLAHDEDISLQNSTLDRRGSSGSCTAGYTACGYYGQVCCLSGSQVCATNAQDQAYCADSGSVVTTAAAATGSGAWQYYTSTYVTTGAITLTSVYSSWVAVSTAVAAVCTPNYAIDQSACGPVCCSSGQYCYDASTGVCKSAGSGGYTTTGVTAAPPTRQTTISGVVTTMTMTPTTTVPYQTPVASGEATGNATLIATSHHSGLSAGAIAGIVIGVLAAIIILILICLCCCLKEAAAGILGIFGIGGKKRERRTVVEEEYIDRRRRYGSNGGSDRRWYGSAAGSRPGRPPPPPVAEKKKSGVGGLGALGLGLGALAVTLGLKRKHDQKKKEEERSDYSSNYDYGSSYYYSASSVSGDTRDDRTRRSSRR